MNEPLVSVIMSVFNEKEENLYLSIKSILNQNYKNIEIIIIDDGSANVVELPYKIKDKVKLIRNSKNQGLAYSLNLGIEISKGKYILRIDSDDFALKERTTIQVNFLENNPEYDLVGSSLYIVDSENKLLGLRSIAKYDELLKKNIWKEIPVPHPSWLIKKKWITKHRYKNNFRRGQDQYLLLTTFRKSKFYVISKPLTCYRLKNISISQRIYGRFSIIRGIFNNKNFFVLLISLLYHSIALIRDILIKNSFLPNKVWNVSYDELDIIEYKKQFEKINKIHF